MRKRLPETPRRNPAPSVRVVVLPVGPGAARRLVAALDVAESPGDLSGRVDPPIRTGRGHLGAGEGLRYAVGAGVRVLGQVVPAALVIPQPVQAAELGDREALLQHERAAGGAVALELAARL